MSHIRLVFFEPGSRVSFRLFYIGFWTCHVRYYARNSLDKTECIRFYPICMFVHFQEGKVILERALVTESDGLDEIMD